MKKINNLLKAILFLFIICFEQNVLAQDSTIVLIKLRKTISGFEIIKENVLYAEIKDSYFQKNLYISNLLRSMFVYDMNKKLYDGTYTNAIKLFEYKGDTLKFIKLYDKNTHRVEDGFTGYWSIEFTYDKNGRIIMETFRDTANSLVKYYPNFDFKPPYIKYEYLGNNSKGIKTNCTKLYMIRC